MGLVVEKDRLVGEKNVNVDERYSTGCCANFPTQSLRYGG